MGAGPRYEGAETHSHFKGHCEAAGWDGVKTQVWVGCTSSSCATVGKSLSFSEPPASSSVK